MSGKHKHIDRRTFLHQASCAAVGYTTLFSTLANLEILQAAAGFNLNDAASNDYKALVCLLNSGGMDSFNMLIPTDQGLYRQYQETRTNLAIPKGELISINPENTGGQTFGLHPALKKVSSLFNDGNLAFISNVGTLVQPMTRQEFYQGGVPLPLGLYSHADQMLHWQTGIPQGRVAQGWGGKIADMLNDYNQQKQIPMCLSVSGSNLFQAGNKTSEFALRPISGAVGIDGFYEEWSVNKMRREAITGMMNQTYQDIYKKTYNTTIKNAFTGFELIQPVLENQPAWNVSFENAGSDWNPSLNMYFEMVARAISGREKLGMNRQIFFIEYGGWDHHDELLNSQNNKLEELDLALSQFYTVLQQMGIEDSVTTFSLSEFGRTLTSNGNGTDHAWGGNTFVMGGAVKGKQIFGTYPQLSLGQGNPLELGGGVLLPTTSADEYFAEIALWFGVPPSELNLLFPNIHNFYSPGSGSNPIGFLQN